MGLGPQRSSSAALKRVLKDLKGLGFRILEHPDYGGVHPVHTRGSWHYDGLAADVNYGAPGAPAIERTKVLAVIPLVEAAGLGLIYARDGVVGSAANHRDHLHIDVGVTSNYGKGLVTAKKANWKQYEKVLAKLQGKSTSKPKPKPKPSSSLRRGSKGLSVRRLQAALRKAFPAYARIAVDGVFGPATEKAVKEFQRRTGLKADGIVGPATKAKLARFGVKF